MDPITIGALTIGVPQLIGWGISIGSIIISNVHTWINERKRKQRDAARLLALQDQVTTTIEKRLGAAATELGQGAVKVAELQKAVQQQKDTQAKEQMERQMQALWKEQKQNEAQINSLMAQLETRSAVLSEQQEQARQAQEKWLQAVKHLDHVIMPLEQLLQQRRAMRTKLLPPADMQPGCKTDDWHITTVVGPAGKGKSSFVRELLKLHNYPDELCEEVRVSAAGAGTLETMPYLLRKHNVLLLDCVGSAAAGHLARSEVLAADTVLIFMSDDARGEELHGDAFALAWRLRNCMHTVFVQPKADMWLQRNRADRSPDDAIGALRYAVLAELHSKLSCSARQAQPGLRDRLAECQLSPAPEVAALLQLVDTMSKRAWVSATASDFWISVHCYYCKTNFVTGEPNEVTRNRVRDEAAEQALGMEAQAVREAAIGALGSRGMPLSLLVPDSRTYNSSISQFPVSVQLNAVSKHADIELSWDNLTVCYGKTAGDGKPSVRSVRWRTPMAANSVVSYFEMFVVDAGKHNIVTCGLSLANNNMSLRGGPDFTAAPGRAPDTIGYHGDGRVYCDGRRKLRQVSWPLYSTGDVVGVGQHHGEDRPGAMGNLFFTLNGQLLTPTVLLEGTHELYPTVGLHSAGARIKVNFGSSPFIFNLRDYLAAAPQQQLPQTVANGSSNP